jgi:hypothetical protein
VGELAVIPEEEEPGPETAKFLRLVRFDETVSQM